MKNQKEVWRDVKNYEGYYQISSFGRVKSLARLSSYSRRIKVKILKPTVDKHGYLKVNFSKDGYQTTERIHILVAVHFKGHIPDGHNIVVDHDDNDKLNNHVDNIKLISHRENSSKDIKGGSSDYIGVYRHKSRSKWVALIQVVGKRVYLGSFADELEAAEAYQKALINVDKKEIES